MNHDPDLFARRSGELDGLFDSHLERGSLDEGNAHVFDSLIDAWLAEELAAIDGVVEAAVTHELRTEHERALARRAAQRAQDEAAHDAQRRRRELRERRARKTRRREARRLRRLARRRRHDDLVAAFTKQLEAERRARIEASVNRHGHDVRATSRRLETANQQLDRASQLLLGATFVSARGAEEPPRAELPPGSVGRVDTATLPHSCEPEAGVRVEVTGPSPAGDAPDDERSSTDTRDSEAA